MGCLYCTSEIKPRMNVIVGRKMHGVNEEVWTYDLEHLPYSGRCGVLFASRIEIEFGVALDCF